MVVSIPIGIPQTGGSGSQGSTGTITDNSGSTGSNGITGNSAGTTTGPRSSDEPCAINPPAGFGFYKVRGGDTVQSISEKFGVPTSKIFELNPGAGFGKGNIILLPGVEAPGMWNVNDYCH